MGAKTIRKWFDDRAGRDGIGEASEALASQYRSSRSFEKLHCYTFASDNLQDVEFA